MRLFSITKARTNGTYNIRIHDLLQREWRNETHEIYGRYTLQVVICMQACIW
ncbi:MAG: hypothetical protein R2778_13280 [Saprospiraceae bacterium]